MHAARARPWQILPRHMDMRAGALLLLLPHGVLAREVLPCTTDRTRKCCGDGKCFLGANRQHQAIAKRNGEVGIGDKGRRLVFSGDK